MTIYLDTPLRQLYLNKLFSVRTYKTLVRANLSTVGDVIAFASPREKLLGLKHFGARFQFQNEVNTFLDLMVPHRTDRGGIVDGAEYTQLGTLIQRWLVVCYNEVVEPNDKIACFFKSLFPNAEALHNWLSDKSPIPLIQHVEFSDQENIALRQLLLSYLDSVMDCLKKHHLRNKLLTRNYQRQKAFLTQFLQYVMRMEMECKADRYEESEDLECKAGRYEESEDLDVLYEKLKATASGRTLHFLSRVAPSYRDLIPYMDKDITAYRALNKGYPVTKTLMEVYAINQQLKVAYKDSPKAEEAVEPTPSIAVEFPFLSDSERTFVEVFLKGHGYYPMFYVLYHYLRVSEKRKDVIYGLHYGIKDGTFHPTATLAERFSVQPGYVRFMLSQMLEVYQTNIFDRDKWYAYGSLFELPYLTADMPVVRHLYEAENIELPFSIFSRLLALVGVHSTNESDRTVECQESIAMRPFEVVSLDGRQLVLNRKRLPFFEIAKVYKLLKKAVLKPYNSDTALDLRSFLKGIPDEQVPMAFDLLCFVARTFLRVEVSDQGICICSRNRLNIASVLCDILTKANKPLTLPEIFAGFKQRYPEQKFHDQEQLRPYLYRCKSIAAIAKTGYYGLLSWNHVFFGNMQDYLFHHLNQMNEPMSLKDLTALTAKNYPGTYARSVQSTMRLDRKNRFVQFQKGYYGLRGKKYDKRFVEKPGSIPGFDEQLAAFKAFVEQHQRYPVYSSCVAEAALSRWFYRASNGLIQLTESQKQMVADCIRVYESKQIPRNHIETAFKTKCDKYKAFLRKEGHVPSHLNSDLYHWMLRARNDYPSFSDHRRLYFADLLAYIRSLGFGE